LFRVALAVGLQVAEALTSAGDDLDACGALAGKGGVELGIDVDVDAPAETGAQAGIGMDAQRQVVRRSVGSCPSSAPITGSRTNWPEAGSLSLPAGHLRRACEGSLRSAVRTHG